MDLSKLEILKERLVSATEFIEIMDYYLTNFAEHPEFMRMAVPSNDAIVKTLTATVFKSMPGHPVAKNSIILKIPGHSFLFGGYNGGKVQGSFIYFDDIQMGLMTTVTLGSSMNNFARFSGMVVNKPSTPNQN